MKNLIGKVLCWLGFREVCGGYFDDGKGNAGFYVECCRCGAVGEETL